MLRDTRDSQPQTAGPVEPFQAEGSAFSELTHAPESQWMRSQLPLLNKILDQLDREDLMPRQRVRALRILNRPLLEMVKALSSAETWDSDPKFSTLHPSPNSAHRLI